MPVQEDKVIKLVDLQFFDGSVMPNVKTINNENFGISNDLINEPNAGQYAYAFSTTERPGLTSDGKPTTLLANSVPLSEINYDDDWGIIDAINEIGPQ